MKSPKDEIIAFKVDKNLKRELTLLSESADVPVSQIIRIAIKNYIKSITGET